LTAVSAFWGETVLAGPFRTAKESRASLHARLDLYPNLLDLMPVDAPGLTVLDYGCGPGHDTLLYLTLGRAGFVYYADISEKALTITEHRLRLHRINGDGKPIAVADGGRPALPRVDRIHCAGVLHHASNPREILGAFRKALILDGDVRLMVYDGELSEHTQSDVPITNWWTQDDVYSMAVEAGFTFMEYRGSYECSSPWRPNCYAACYRLR
jgi:SAM-dependent methyltransferase